MKMDTLEYIKKVNKFENESRKSVKKIVIGQDAKGDEMRVINPDDIFECQTIKMEHILTITKFALLGHEIRSDFAGNLFYFDGVSTRPLNIKIEELKNTHDKLKDEVKK